MSKKCVNGCDGITTGCSQCPKKIITVEKEIPDISYELVEGIVKHLQGQILTLAEATVEDSRLKATKDLIKGHFNDTYTRLFEPFMYHGTVSEGALPDYNK